MYIYLSLCATRSVTFCIRFGTNTYGTSYISSPPSSFENVNGAFSACKLSPMISFAIFLCFLSLASSILNSSSQLYIMPQKKFTFPTVWFRNSLRENETAFPFHSILFRLSVPQKNTRKVWWKRLFFQLVHTGVAPYVVRASCSFELFLLQH